MLILKRPVGSRTRITVPPSDTPTVIDVQIVRFDHFGIKLGFEAPRQVHILRDDAVRKTKGD